MNAKVIIVILVAFVLLLALGGCAYTVDGQKVPREVYRTEANRDLMVLAVAADREYDARNPIQPPPAVCQTGDAATMDGMDLAYCAMAMATYNAQLQVREMQRKSQAQYAAAVIDRQADERMAKWQLALNNPVTAAVAGRLINGKPQAASSGPRISVRGHSVASRGSGGGGGAGGAGGDTGTAGSGAGGGAETGVNGDQNVMIVVGDGNQSSGGSNSSFNPALEWATDMAYTSPSLGEGASDNRSERNDDTIGFGEGLF